MLEPNIDPTAAQPPLPLFRPEVLACQQQKFYGEVLLIRPFSAAFFIWLGLLLAGAVLGILLLGHYTEDNRPDSGHQQSTALRDVKAR
ncbi:MAG TPA: hypothetical protein VI685_17635 [Candidatus Angelobacter sp.]